MPSEAHYPPAWVVFDDCTLNCCQCSSTNVPFVPHWQTVLLANVNPNVIDHTRMWQKICEHVWQFICNVHRNGSFTEENVTKNMDNIMDRWNEVNSKSLYVDKQRFIEKVTPYCMHKWSYKEKVWCWFLILSNSVWVILGGNIACYCCYFANQTGCNM